MLKKFLGGFARDDKDVIALAIRQKKYQQVPFNLSSSSKTLRIRGKVGAGELDLTGAIGVIIRSPSADITAYFDADTTKTWAIAKDVTHEILIDPSVGCIVLTGTVTGLEVGGF